MTQPTSRWAAKFLYGLTFVVILPAILILWAHLTDPDLWPLVPGTFPLGVALAVIGIAFILAGMLALYIYGKGLPMNAFPPVEFVTQGVFRLLPHPIYTGFVTACFGVAMATQSRSGFWLITPLVLLGCIALVQGFEKQDLARRFPSAIAQPLLRLPAAAEQKPTIWDRLSVYVLVFLPWALMYQAVSLMGIPADAVAAYFDFESALPVIEWMELFYASAYPFALLVPLIAARQRDLREFSIAAWCAMLIVFWCFLAFPLIAPPRAFTPTNFLGRWLIWERAFDTPAAAFPSFHVVWAWLAARAFALTWPRARVLWWLWASLISASCIATGMHALIDVAGGIAVYGLVANIESLWQRSREQSERVANSWREWRIGSLRIINHGVYAALGAFCGLAVAGTLLGAAYVLPMFIIACCALVGAALWAQWIEGSPSLLRPYGWYGGLVGVGLGALISHWLGADLWLLLAAFSVSAPWIQAIGRLRCFVQGCCHGGKTTAEIGIRYTHPRSRVCRLSHLTGIPIHATPLYSILWNLVLAAVLLRLWLLHFPPNLIVGMNLILSGLGRFVEESLRGEPQTPIKGGLRLYQWVAIFSVLLGIAMTMFRMSARTPNLQFNLETVYLAVAFGLFTGAAMGVDFPESNRRFARLA